MVVGLQKLASLISSRHLMGFSSVSPSQSEDSVVLLSDAWEDLVVSRDPKIEPSYDLTIFLFDHEVDQNRSLRND